MNRLHFHTRSAIRALLVLAVVCPVALSATASAAEPPVAWTRCPSGSQAGDCKGPRGIAVDPATGRLYVADSLNNRVVELDAWGTFVKAWGWGVRDGSPELQSCTSLTGCRDGLTGAGAGEFSKEAPQGVAVDPAGDVFVVDRGNDRVEKFNPAGGLTGEEAEFLLMFGGDVNQTKVSASAPEAQRNLCPVDPGDICKAGTGGAGKGQFVNEETGGVVASLVGSFIAVDPTSSRVYVGDLGRVEEFALSGAYLGDLPDPEGVLAGKEMRALTVGPAGDLYVSFDKPGDIGAEPGVLKLSPSGVKQCSISASDPVALATDAAGDLYVLNVASAQAVNLTAVEEFDAGCVPVAGGQIKPSGQNETWGTGLATGSTCGANGVDVYVTEADEGKSYVRSYGPLPNPAICAPPPAAPQIMSQFAVSVATESAVVKAQINPVFWPDATYYVEYGTGKCLEGGCDHTLLFPGVKLGAGVDMPLDAEAIVTGLAPDTAYHYRFVAQSSGGGPVYGIDPDGEGPQSASFGEGAEATFTTYPRVAPSRTDCPNQALRTGLPGLLPDCRAYEMVSPIDKEGGEIFASSGADLDRPARFEQTTPDGDRLTYSSYRAFGADASGAPIASQYIASRDAASGWSNQNITAPVEGPHITEGVQFFESPYKAFSEDLCSGWLLEIEGFPLAPGAVPGYVNLYRRQTCGAGAGAYETLSDAEPGGGEPAEYVPSIQGFSSDGSVGVFRAQGRLTEEASGAVVGGQSVYQVYRYSEGGLRLVSVLPDGSPSSVNNTTGAGNDTPTSFRGENDFHAVSVDGSRVFWTALGIKETRGHLYLRVNAGQEQSVVSGGHCTEPEQGCTIPVSQTISEEPSEFYVADPRGSKALFSVGASAGGAGLYLFDVEEALGEETAATLVANDVRGVMGASEDLTRVYFVSTDVLDGKANRQGEVARAGLPNLYLYRADQGNEAASTVFIATLANGDVDGAAGPIADEPYRRVSRVSPDGLHAVFMSRADLTGYDNTDTASGEADSEVFRYDAASGGLACLSCDPSGARPSGRDVAGSDAPINGWLSGIIPGWPSELHPSRLLSSDGSRVFFESFESLVLRDTNGRADVYEWEQGDSQRDCEQRLGAELYVAAAEGCFSLISSGESSADSRFVDASSDGSDVFFATAASLVSQDPGLIDIYDARVDGGFASPAVRGVCEGEACQAPARPPIDATPASVTFSGEGNLTVEPAVHVQPKKKALTRKQKLARALKACKRKHGKNRTHCQRQARKRYTAKATRTANHGRAAR